MCVTAPVCAAASFRTELKNRMQRKQVSILRKTSAGESVAAVGAADTLEEEDDDIDDNDDDNDDLAATAPGTYTHNKHNTSTH